MKIAFIGAGAMGGAMAEGFVKSGLFAPADVTVSAPHKSTTDRFAALGVNATCDNREAAMGADVVVVAVKPWLVGEVVAEIKPVLDYSRQTILSVAAGVSGADLTAMLERDGGSLPPVFIAIPNIAIAIGCSMTYVLPVNTPGKGDTRRMADMFNAVGETMIIEERLLPAVVQSSCSIAYAMRYIGASVAGFVQLGFKAAAARDVVLQTVKGAVAILQANGTLPEAEIYKVTTPGGYTIRGLNEMERAGFTNAVIRGLVDNK